MHRPAMLAVFLLLSCSSCATILAGTEERVQFWTENRSLKGATVLIGEEEHPVPSAIDVHKETKTVTFKHPSFKSVVVELDREFRWGMLVSDILFTPGYGLIGILVDSSTSAWYRPPVSG